MGEIWCWIRESITLIDWAAIAALVVSTATLIVIACQTVLTRRAVRVERTIQYLARFTRLRQEFGEALNRPREDDKESMLNYVAASGDFFVLLDEMLGCRKLGILDKRVLDPLICRYSGFLEIKYEEFLEEMSSGGIQRVEVEELYPFLTGELDKLLAKCRDPKP